MAEIDFTPDTKVDFTPDAGISFMPDDSFDAFTRKYPAAWGGAGVSGDYVRKMYPRLSKNIADKMDGPVADFTMRSIANGVKEQEIIDALGTGSLESAATYLDEQKEMRKGSLRDDVGLRSDAMTEAERLEIINSDSSVNITDRSRYWESFKEEETAEASSVMTRARIEFQKEGIDKPLRKVLGGIAYTETKLATGLLLHTPELLLPDLAERIHKGIAGYEVGAEAKTVGDFVEFVGGIKTAGWLVKPLVGLMNAGEVATRITGGGATFMLRNLPEQIVDKIMKGEPISGKELFVETLIGAGFGAVGAGVVKAGDTIKWLQSAARSPAGKRVPLRLWLRAKEAARALYQPGMTQDKWDKSYRDDIDRLGKTFYDAHAADTLRKVPQITGDVAKPRSSADIDAFRREAAQVGEGGLVRAGRGTAAPPPIQKGQIEVGGGISMFRDEARLRELSKPDAVMSDEELARKEVFGMRRAEVAAEGEITTPAEAKPAAKTELAQLASEVDKSNPKVLRIMDEFDKAVLVRDVKKMDSLLEEAHQLWQKTGKNRGLVAIMNRAAANATPDAKPAAEPHLFQPTQLMKRVPTPGTIQPKRRVLTPQPTALATVKKWSRLKSESGPSGKPLVMPVNPVVKWSMDYLHARNTDIERIYGFNPGPVPKDPSFVRRRGELLRTMAKQQEKYSNRYQKKLDAGVEPRNINVLNPVSSSRYMWMQIDDRYGVPVWLVSDRMYGEVGRSIADADTSFGETIQARHTVGITKADDDKIADWLDSNDARRNILAKDMSEDSLMLAAKEEDLLQGPLANSMKMMIAGRWIDVGDMPSDIKHFVPVAKEWQTDASNKNYIDGVLNDAKAADDAGTLLDHVTNVEPWKSGLGVRRNYYMSEPGVSDIIDDVMSKMGIGVFDAPSDATKLPGTYSYDAKPRRGSDRKRKGGSSLNAIYNKYLRVSAYNAARPDMKILSDRLQYVQLSNVDKSGLTGMLDNLLRKHSMPKRGFRAAIKIKRAYWTTSFSPLVRPGTALYRIIRNAPQNIAFGPYGLSMPQALKHAEILTKNRGRLHEFDPEMMKRFDRNFAANVSQRKAMWTEFYMQDSAKVTEDFNRRALTNKAISLLEASGTGYMAVDDFSRRCIWLTEYQVVKEATQDFLNGKINQDQFYDQTKLDTVHRQQQLLVHDMLSNGRVDDMAEQAADWLTEDVNMKYKTESRSLIEQSPEERVFFGPITFNRGRLEHGYYRGVRAFIDGVHEGNPGKAYRGATNLIKGIVASKLVSAALVVLTGKVAYDITSQFTFGLLDPGTSKFHDAAGKSFNSLYLHTKGEQGLLSTIDNVADAWATAGESLFIPYSIELMSLYESANDKAGMTSFRVIRNGVAAKLGIDVNEFNTVSRSTKDKVLHALWGTKEYPSIPEGYKAKPGKAKKKK